MLHSKSLGPAALLVVSAALAQPIDLISNARSETPSRNGLAASSFDVNGAAVARGSAELQLQLPAGPMTILRRKNFQGRNPNAALWRGSANLRSDSDVVLTLRNGFLAGTIQIGQDLYEIRPQGNRHIIEKLNLASFPQCGGQVRGGTAADTGAAAGQTSGGVSVAGDSATVTIDLLSVYTPQARAAAGGTGQIEAIIQSAVDYANVAFANSQVNTVYRLARAAEVAHDDAGDLNVDLTWVRADPTVASLRNSSGADMVSLIVENGAGYCGMGYVMRSVGSGFASSAFQVTARGCAVGNLSFAHEHGHNLGFEHDPVNGTSPTSASYPWSFGHLVNGSYRTVMSYASECPNGCTRVPYLSNPSVIYAGVPTGIADQRDNARTARQTTPVAAAFRAEAPTSAPAAPSALTAVAVSTQVNLTWSDNSSNESGFSIERSTDGATFSPLTSVGAGVTAFSNTGLSGGTTYTYRVRAFNSVGSSDPTNDASATTPTAAPPDAPTTLAAVVASASQINLSWVDKSGNETGFRIERSSGGGSFAEIATTGANVSSYASTGLASNTTYTYRVRAYNSDGASAYTNTASALTPQSTPSTPGGFGGSPKYSGSGKNKTLTAVALAWSDVADNTGYELERCKQGGKGRTVTCDFAPLTTAGADASSLIDSSAASTGNGTYQYRIRSVNSIGSSVWTVTTVNAN